MTSATAPDPVSEPVPWWRSAVVYQIYPRSFADSNGDGIGDLGGVRAHLDHLVWLGVDALWLSPFYRSPMADYGYDVSDYCDVDPLFGTLDDFDALVAEAHERGLKVVVDWVPNHSSDQHPWFVESRSSRDNPKADWYIWRDPAPDGGVPNNWIRSWSDQSAWTFDETRGQYYLHCFLPEQPDLNWANPQVEAAMQDTLRFWLDRGVDGFRMDVIHLIGKDPALPDDPEDLAALSHVPLNHRPETHALLRGLRRLLDSYDGDRMSVGEVYLLDTADVATYYGDHDELHLNFNFPPLFTAWDAGKWAKQIARAEAELNAIEAWPTWVLSNHDNRRHATRYGGREDRSRAAAVLLLTLRGTPFLYAGEELGLEDAVIPPDRVVDPGGRDGCRGPIPWDPTPEHGWGTDDPWLPWPPDPDLRNAQVQVQDPASIAHLYRRLLGARRGSPALRLGSYEPLEAPEGILAFRRAAGDDVRTVLINFTDAPVEVPVAGTVEVATTGAHEGAAFAGRLDAGEAVVLRP
jgi:alpha-glucosidase